MDASDLTLLIETARHILAGDDATLLVAELAEAGIAAEIVGLPASRDICARESGHSYARVGAAGALFAVQGAQLARSTLLDLLVAGLDHRPNRRVVLPVPGSRTPPGRLGGDAVVVDGVVLVPEAADELLVHTGSTAVVVPAGSLAPVEGFDPALRMATASGVRPVLGPAPARDWDTAVDTAAWGIAHELVGVGQRALDIASAHVTEREQFGRPIAALQSVRHRLVDVHVELEAARAVLAASGPGDEIAAMTAKAVAGRAALGAGAAAQQLCGAMGFTAEHGLHAVVRRAYLLDSLFGCADDLEIEIGALLAARGATPAPVPLQTGGGRDA